MTLFWLKQCCSSKQLDYATPRSTSVCMFSGVTAVQFSPVACKNEKTNEYSEYLWIQKYIKVNSMHTLANCSQVSKIKYADTQRCSYISLLKTKMGHTCI